MTDLHTHIPIRVLSDRGTKPYRAASLDQLNRLREILDANGISYWVDHLAISIDDGPAMTAISLRGKIDVREVQKILDSVV